MVLVGCGLYSPNSFFVREDLITDAFSAPRSPDRFFNRFDYEKIVSFPGGIPEDHPRAGNLKKEEREMVLRINQRSGSDWFVLAMKLKRKLRSLWSRLA